MTATARRAVGRLRRYHRMLIPLGLAALLIVTTLVTRSLDQPDPTDGGFLSPVAAGPDGGSRLAEALRGRGVGVQRETGTRQALAAARSGPATLFVPSPALVHPRTVTGLGDLPAGTRVVLVDPPRRVLRATGLAVAPADRRWAAQAVGPDAPGATCRLPDLAGVDRVALGLQRWTAAPVFPVVADLCFAEHLVRLGTDGGRRPTAEIVVAGGSDPFRNDRLDEWDNLAFATALLGGTGRVVWLDLGGPEPAPTYPRRPTGDDPPAWSPTPGNGDGDGSGDGPPGDGSGTGDGEPGESGRPGEPGDGDPGGPAPDSADGDADAAPPNPLWNAFPGWFWALLLQLALAALAAALWRARRLGPPTTEPLPVTVRSAETVRGRARLYQRAGARGAAARTLRGGALTRLLPRLNLPTTTPPYEVAVAVAARTGQGTAHTANLLYGPAPDSDQELLALARALDEVARTVAPHTAAPLPPADAAHPHQL